MSPSPPSFTTALLAGGIAGTTVDLTLFPLDTLKTRLQAREGFLASGGFRGIYRGVGSAVVGSAPGAAFFFVTYEGIKSLFARSRPSSEGSAVVHMVAASAGEIAACTVRVPTEVVKQRAQAGQYSGSSAAALRHILSHRHHDNGGGAAAAVGRLGGLGAVWRELYRGWGITVVREVPFTVIQFPLWEGMKAWGRGRNNGIEVSAAESAAYGSVAGGVAAALTTPLDVLKTRVMLSRERESAWSVFRGLMRDGGGVRTFFAGVGPRVMWISIGGAIFLGSYQWVVNSIQGRERRPER